MLPSQSPRSPSRRASKRRRGPGRRFLGLLLIVISAVALIWWSLDGGGADEEPAGRVQADLGDDPSSGPVAVDDAEKLATSPTSLPPSAATPEVDLAPTSGDGGGTPAADTEQIAQGETTSTGALGRPERLDPGPPPATDPASLALSPEATESDPDSGPGPSEVEAGVTGRPSFLALLSEGQRLLATGRPVEARATLSQALRSGGLEEEEAATVRSQLMQINERLIFSPEIVPDDPFTETHVIKSGESLGGIAKDWGLQTDWRFIQRINRIDKPERIRAGQRIKLITGPFHAVVDKTDFRMDLYLGNPNQEAEEDKLVYAWSFPVGLGEFDSTPTGLFRVRQDSKLINPQWTNPRTGERFESDDPANPIGERWIGLNGVDAHLEAMTGYGIHGTIDLESIGREASMGCVRMRADDVAIVYEMLTEGVSCVQIVEEY